MSKFNSFLGHEKISEALSQRAARVHFVGVGGVGMYSLFKLSKERGYSVTGSDSGGGELFERLKSEGADVYIGNRRESLEGAALCVYSLAVDEGDPEIRAAEERGIPLVSRAEYLSYLAEEYKRQISVSGSHGKSTVTAMLASVFKSAELSPSVVCGAALSSGGEPFISGKREYFIFESCEYKDSFLKFSPDIALFTNLELDHTDYFKTLDDIKRSFAVAMERAGVCIINADDDNLRSSASSTPTKSISYGVYRNADFRAVDIKENVGKYSFSVLKDGERIAKIELSTAGAHNLYNALGAFSASVTAGISPECAARALSSFSGIPRRLEKIGEHKGAPVYYDYAHHPSEIKAGIESVRAMWQGEVNVIFKPHTYTRTKDLLGSFRESLSLADRVIILPIDGIREKDIKGVSAASLADEIGKRAAALSEDEALEVIQTLSGAVIIMGAANLYKIKSSFTSEKA